MNLLNTPERRVVAANFLLQLGFQSTYFVGVIGCATYVLGAGAFEVSALVFCLNLALIVGNFFSGAVVDAVGPRKTLAVTLAALAACGVLGLLAPVMTPPRAGPAMTATLVAVLLRLFMRSRLPASSARKRG